MLSAKNKVVITVFGVLAVIIFMMYVLDRSSNKRVEQFRDTENDEDEEEEDENNVEDNDDEEEEEEKVPKSKLSKKTYETLPIANKNTMKETSIPSGSEEQLIHEEPIQTSDNDDVVSYVSKWVSGLNIPSTLKTETFKELFSEENIEKMKSMVSLQQAKDWASSIVSSLTNNKEAFASTISQRRTINQLKDKLKQMEDDLDNLIDDLDEVNNKNVSKDMNVKRESGNEYVSFGLAPAPSPSSRPIFNSNSTKRTINDTEISINSLPSVSETNQQTKSALPTKRLTDKDPLFAKNSDTVSSSLGKKLAVGSNNVIEGFENVRYNFAQY
jgi:FtsZ-interacting cell division protein ZipA